MRAMSLTEGWKWTRESASAIDPPTRTVSWRCEHGSDYWRLTASRIVTHNGHSFLHEARGDFSLSASFSAKLSERYDQCGLILIKDELEWLKTSFEMDGRLCVGAVNTRGTSDWSRSLTDRLTALRVQREGDAVEVSTLGADGEWAMIRHLTIEDPLQVGLYSAAPIGAGFTTIATEVELLLGH